MMWYTRDDSGGRALWEKEPTKDGDGDWSVDGSLNYLIAGDFTLDRDVVDALLGKGLHGLRKGQKRKISVYWSFV